MPETHPATYSVRDLKAPEAVGKTFAAVLVARRLAIKTAANGNPFLSVEFGDRTGSFSCTVFSDNPVYEILRAAPEGSVFRLEGKVDTFQGRLSPRLTRAAALTATELNSPEALAGLVETAPEDAAGLWSECEAFIASIRAPELRATVRGVFDELGEAFRTAPAAVLMHHAYRHGLLEHTVHMARAAAALLPLYREADPDLVMAGILLHDTGKTIEYEAGLSVRRTRRGMLHGHVVLGYQLARKAALAAKLDSDRLERLEHIILSHQGELEYGAAALAATPEAVLVSMIDNLDARMGMVQRALRQAQPNEEFSERIPGLNTPVLTRPPPPPA